MKNNKGQALVLVIALLPLILLLFLKVVEVANIAYQKNKAVSNIKTIIKSCLNKCTDDEIISLFDKNNISYDKIKIDNDKELDIDVDINISSSIGKIKDSDYYKYNVHLVGYVDDKEVKIKKGM